MAPPKGPRAQAQAPVVDRNPPSNEQASGDTPAPIGPLSGRLTVCQQYTYEQQVRHLLTLNRCDPAREDNFRLQGVQLIDTIRQLLQL